MQKFIGHHTKTSGSGGGFFLMKKCGTPATFFKLSKKAQNQEIPL
jgi:hypothetical protein